MCCGFLPAGAIGIEQVGRGNQVATSTVLFLFLLLIKISRRFQRDILAGAIGIEPTLWESEAHVLPLHQAPVMFALYIIRAEIANTFCTISKNKLLFLDFCRANC